MVVVGVMIMYGCPVVGFLSVLHPFG